MKIKLRFIILFIIMINITITGCQNKKVSKVIEGKYISVDGESYIVVDDYKKGKSDEFDEVIGYCNIQLHNVDLTAFEDFYLSNNTANYLAVNTNGNVSDEQMKEIQDILKSRVDFKKQFEDNKAEFFYFKDAYGDYGLGCEVDGSGFDQGYETYLSLGYSLKDKTIIIDEVKYILQE